MEILQSNSDVLLVAVPMIGILFACFFRVDEMIGKPHKKVEQRRQFAGVDRDGEQICTDPDGTSYPRKARNGR